MKGKSWSQKIALALTFVVLVSLSAPVIMGVAWGINRLVGNNFYAGEGLVFRGSGSMDSLHVLPDYTMRIHNDSLGVDTTHLWLLADVHYASKGDIHDTMFANTPGYLTSVSTGDITDQTIVKADIDTTSTFVFGAIYHKTSAVADSQYMSKKYIDDAAAGLVAQSVKGDHVDSTAENFVFDGAYHITSAVAESAYITQGTFDKVTDDTTNWNTAYDSTSAWDNRGYPDATTTDQGIASFNTANFSVTTGDVTVKSGGINSDELLNQTVVKADIDTTSGFVFGSAYLITSAQSDSQFMTKAYIDSAGGGGAISDSIWKSKPCRYDATPAIFETMEDSIGIYWWLANGSWDKFLRNYNLSGSADDQIDTVVFSLILPVESPDVDSVIFDLRTNANNADSAGLTLLIFKRTTPLGDTVRIYTGSGIATNSAISHQAIAGGSISAISGGDKMIFWMIGKMDVADTVEYNEPIPWSPQT